MNLVGKRVCIKGNFGTIRYKGSIDGYAHEYIGIEWDKAERGRHSGSINGKEYFSASKPNSASFIKLTPDFGIGISFDEAVNMKYGAFDVKYSIMGFNSMNICLVDSFSTVYTDVVSLDISENLLCDWSEILDLLKHFPNLKTLDCSKMPLKRCDSVRSYNLLSLIALDCCIENNIFYELSQMFPMLETLYLGFNKISLSITATNFQHLKLLSLENNEIMDWSILSPLKTIDSLHTLNLNCNSIPSIMLEEEPGFKGLRYLYIENNRIVNYACVEHLEQLNLHSIFCLKNPLEIASDDFFNELLTRNQKLSVINGEIISLDTRREAEISYFKRIWNLRSLVDFASSHPLFPKLLEKYGEVSEKAILNRNIISLNVSFDNVIKTIEVPKNFTIRKLKMMLKKMFNISDDFRLYYTLSVDQKLFLNRLNDEIDKYEITIDFSKMQSWFSGIIAACHAADPGSIPGGCMLFDPSKFSSALPFCMSKKIAHNAFVVGNYLDAEKFYTEAIRKEPNDYDLFLRRSVTNQKLKRMSKAMEDAKTLIKLDSANAIGYIHFAKLLREGGKEKQFRALMKMALENVSPTNPLYKKLLEMNYSVKTDLTEKRQKRNPVDHLPFDILMIVFSFCGLNSYPSLMRVCKRWNEFIALNPILWSTSRISKVVDNVHSHKIFRIVGGTSLRFLTVQNNALKFPVLLSRLNEYRCDNLKILRIENYDFDPLSSLISQVSLPSLSSVVLKKCRIPENMLYFMLSNFTALSSLHLESVESRKVTLNGIPDLLNLTEIHVEHVNFFTDAILFNLLSRMKIIKSLSLKTPLSLNIDQLITFDFSELESFSVENVTVTSETGLDLSTFIIQISRDSKLKSLELCRMTLYPLFVETVSISFPSLQKLSLSRCNVDSIDLSLLWFTQLSSLNISGIRFNSQEMINFLSRTTCLSEVIMADSVCLNDNILSQLSKLMDLKILDLQGCPNITDLGISHLSKSRSLTLLNIYNCPKVSLKLKNQLRQILPKHCKLII